MDNSDSSDSEIDSDCEYNPYSGTLFAFNSLSIQNQSIPHQTEILCKLKPNGLPVLKSQDYFSPETTRAWPSECIVGGVEKCPFICSICLGLPRYPVELQSCGHFFCECCVGVIVKARSNFSNPKKCPKCQRDIISDDILHLRRRSQCNYNEYNALEVRCFYGCGKVSSPSAMLKHECVECTKRPVKCTHPTCNIQLPDSEMESHLPICEHRSIFCNRCKLPMPCTQKKHNCVHELTNTIKSMKYIF